MNIKTDIILSMLDEPKKRLSAGWREKMRTVFGSHFSQGPINFKSGFLRKENSRKRSVDINISAHCLFKGKNNIKFLYF